MKEKIKVLLAEDELTLAMIIKDTLEEDDFILTIAANGEEGLRMFFDIRPDVLVADVMMPRMDGFEMVRRIRQTDKQTPVLFLTARSAINDVVEGFELGTHAVTWVVWANPRSLATTRGIIIYFLFLQVLRCFSSLR